MQIVLATRNQHKKQELVALLGGMDITIRTLDDFPDAPDVVEALINADGRLWLDRIGAGLIATPHVLSSQDREAAIRAARDFVAELRTAVRSARA